MKNVHRHLATLPWQPIFFSEGAPSGIFSKKVKKSKLSILEIGTFDSKPTIYC